MKNTISAKNKYEPDALRAGRKEVLHEKERKRKCQSQIRQHRKAHRRSPLLGDPQIVRSAARSARRSDKNENKRPPLRVGTDNGKPRKCAAFACFTNSVAAEPISFARKPHATGASLRFPSRKLFFEFCRVFFQINLYDAHHFVIFFLRLVKKRVGDGGILPFRGI